MFNQRKRFIAGFCPTKTGVTPLKLEGCFPKLFVHNILYGNSVQSGTPTPNVPTNISGVGDLVSSGEHTGKYAIKENITANASTTTYTVYTDSQLYKVGNYADSVDFATGEEIRNVGKLVFDGTENWAEYARISKCFYVGIEDAKASQNTNILCSHYEAKAQGTNKGVYCGATNIGTVQCGSFYFTDTDYADVTAWKAFVAAQYAAGTPITIYYRLSNPTTLQNTAVPIIAENGDNYIENSNDVLVSNVSVTYRSRTP